MKKIEDRLYRDKLQRKRAEEINKRKFSYFNDKKSINEKKDVDQTKYFFDENSILRTFGDKQIQKKNELNDKKKLEKKNLSREERDELKSKKSNELLSALNAPASIVELKEQKFKTKKEILFFKNIAIDLGIRQKKKLIEFSNVIKDKPVKIIITTELKRDSENFLNMKKLIKSRALLVRTFLMNQGISHNRITIQTKEKNISENWKNEIILTFIGV